MDVIQLPKNFTSPKQSEYLLRLHIPKNTAEYSIVCSIELPRDWREHRSMIEEGTNHNWFVFRNYLENRTYEEEEAIWKKHDDPDIILPSWSFGRLVDIYELCTGKTYKRDRDKSLMDDIISKIEYSINRSIFHRFDFSKLENNVKVSPYFNIQTGERLEPILVKRDK